MSDSDRAEHWAVGPMREVQRALATLDFENAAALALAAGERALAAGDVQSWRRFSCRRAAAVYNLSRFDEAVQISDDVLASMTDGEYLHTQAHARNIGTMAADRLFRDDTLERLDGAIAVGERIQREEGTVDSLQRTAWTAGSLGLAELGEAMFAEITTNAGSGTEAALPPVVGAYMLVQQLTLRNWWALSLEHIGDARAREVFERNIATVRGLPELLPFDRLPSRIVAVYRGFEGLALVALGRVDEAEAALVVAESVRLSSTPDVLSSAVALLSSAARMRSKPPADPLEALSASADMVRVARGIGDRRGEAEHLRLATVAALRTGDEARVALARDRFAALVDRLDWSRRLKTARMTSVRSRALQRVARAVAEDAGDGGSRAVIGAK